MTSPPTRALATRGRASRAVRARAARARGARGPKPRSGAARDARRRSVRSRRRDGRTRAGPLRDVTVGQKTPRRASFAMATRASSASARSMPSMPSTSSIVDGPVTTSDVHVLVVDDERICRTVTSSLLRRCGYRVTTAASGEEALELLRRGTEFHMLLTDVMMPGIDGPALLQIVRNDERLRDMPVIMMSANEHSESVFRCIQHGAEDYLLKPVTKRAVKHMWQHVWRKSQAQLSRAVPRFENGQEVLEDDDDRGELVHGVPAVPEHVEGPSHSGEDDGFERVLSPEPTDIRRNASMLSLASAGLGAKVSGGLFSTSIQNEDEDGSQRGTVSMVIDDETEKPSSSRTVPERQIRALPRPLAGLENGPRRLRDWLDDETAGAQATERVDRWHVAWRITAFVHAIGPRACASYEMFDANCLDISPQGDISFASDSLEDERSFVDLAQELDDKDPLFVIALVILNMFWPEVFITVYEAEYPEKALQQVIAMSGFAKTAMTAEGEAAKVLTTLLRRTDRATAHDASEHFRRLAGDARAYGVETERRLETLTRLETVMAMLRAAKSAQLHELKQSRAALDLLISNSRITYGDVSERSSDAHASRKRSRMQDGSHGDVTCYDDGTLKHQNLESVVSSAFRSPKSLEPHVFTDLEISLFDKCAEAMKASTSNGDSDGTWLKRLGEHGAQGGYSLRDALDEFENEICLVTRSVSLKRCASIGGDFADFAANNSMVCCASWDREAEIFATAGTSRSICVYETEAVMRLGARVHCPAVEFEAHAKVSALCFNNYVKQSVASGDYQGVVQMWDVHKEVSTWENNTHRRRVWSLDFSCIDPTKLASGSDDGTVRVFSTKTKEATCTIQNRANVCSVKFHPMSAHLLAIGSADHKIHCYDLRQSSSPLITLQGHRKAVSYVHWIGDELVSASTDNTLKLWDVKQSNPQLTCIRTYTGHSNEKNFVGLSASSEGYIACGSEDNIVYLYAKHSSAPITTYGFADKPTPLSQSRRDKGGFISSVVWSPESKYLLAANSRGHLKILELTKSA